MDKEYIDWINSLKGADTSTTAKNLTTTKNGLFWTRHPSDYVPYKDYTGSVQDLENDDEYKKFTTSIIDTLKSWQNDRNTDITPIVTYFNWLDEKAGVNRDGRHLNISRFIKNQNWTQNDFDQMLNDYQTARTDNKMGYYHWTPKVTNTVTSSANSGNIKEQSEPGSQTVTEDQTASTGNTGASTSLGKMPKYDPFKPTPRYNYPGWSDWIPLTMNRILDQFNITKQNKLEKLKRVPLKEPVQKNYKITNAYAQRQLLEQEKNELRNQAEQNQTSDVNENLRRRTLVENKIDQLNNKQLQLKSYEFADTTQKAQEIANENLKQRIDTANINREQLAAKWNSMLNADQQAAEKENAAAKQYNLDMYTNYGEYLKNKRLNENGRTYLSAEQTKAKAIQDITSLASKYENDLTAWEGYKTALQELVNDNELAEGDVEYEYIKGLLNDQNVGIDKALSDPRVQAWVKNKLANPTTQAARKWSSLRQQFLEQVKQAIEGQQTKIMSDYYEAMSGMDLFPNNQWGWPTSSRASVLMHKSGSKIDRMSKFIQLEQKERQNVRKNLETADKQISKDMNAQLDRLNKEALLLLRSIFK